MTAFLMCDACSGLVSEHAGPEATEPWLSLDRNPTVGGGVFRTSFHSDVHVHGDWPDDDDVGGDVETDEPDTDAEEQVSLHFCSMRCLADWSVTAAEQEPVP